MLEAAGYLATLQSFRGSPKEALVRRGTDRAILRAETRVEDRTLTIEAEITAAGRSRTQVNRQAVRRRGDLHEALRVTVFSPEDIGVVRAGPADRRRFLDGTLAVVDPRAARSAEEVDKVLRQRVRCCARRGRSLRPDAAATLDVWDSPPGRGRISPGGGPRGTGRPPGAAGGAALRPPRRHPDRRSGWPTGVHGRGGCSTHSPSARDRDVRRGVSTGRTPPGRARAHPGRAALPHARLAGGAALARAGPPVGRPRAGHRCGSAPLRYCCSTTCSPNSTRCGPVPSSKGLPPGQALVTTARRRRPRSTATRAYGMAVRSATSPASGSPRRQARAAGTGENSGHVRWKGRSRPLSNRLGLRGAQGVARLFAGWSGDRGAGDRRPRRSPSVSTRDALVVAVDHPAWATQVRRLGDTLLDQAADVAGLTPAGPARDPGSALTAATSRARGSVRGVGTGGYTGTSESEEDPRVWQVRSGARTASSVHRFPFDRTMCERARPWR